MRVDYIDGKVWLYGFQENTTDKNDLLFMSACQKYTMWWDFGDEQKRLEMTSLITNNVRAVMLLEKVIRYAEMYGIMVSESVRAALEFYSAKLQTEKGKQELQHELDMKRTVWKRRQEEGCMTCSFSRHCGGDIYRCAFSGDELEPEVFSQYDPTTGVYDMFCVRGKPNEHCKDYLNEEIRR